MNITERIFAKMKELGLKQVDLAKGTNAAKGTVSLWVNGQTVPSGENLIKLANTLKVSPEWLQTGKEPKQTYHNPNIDPISPLLADMSPTARRKIPIISYVQAGNWVTLVDNFSVGDADEWVETNGKYSETAYALRVHGSSMEPTIQENAIIIVDPQEQWDHNKIVVVRQNGDAEVTVKRIVKDGSSWLLKPDNTQFPIMKMLDDAHICGVVKEMVVRF